MNRPQLIALPLAAALASLVGCQGRLPPPPLDPNAPRPGEAAVVSAARAQFPRTLEMHQLIVARSCAPNTGVCHNTSNYPDLSTPGALLQSVGGWCNLEIPDPTQGADVCERRGDFIVLGADSDIVIELAWAQREGINRWRFGLRDALPAALVDSPVYFYDGDGNEVLLSAPDWLMFADGDADAREVLMSIDGLADNPFIETYVDEVLASLVGGDPNRNGTFGADALAGSDSGAKVIDPGSLARSYLWGRITGTVDGSRMPLANQDLSDPEYVAIACFIETLEDRGASVTRTDAIDYDNCAFAQEPISYTVLVDD